MSASASPANSGNVMDVFHQPSASPFASKLESGESSDLQALERSLDTCVDNRPFYYEVPHEETVERWLRHNVLGARKGCAYIDTTTLLDALELTDSGISRGTLTQCDGTEISAQRNLHFAFELWDIATIVNAIVLFDNVFCCANEHLRDWARSAVATINHKLSEEVIRELPVVSSDSSHPMASLMEAMWFSTQSFVSRLEKEGFASETDRYRTAWQSFLGPSARFELYRSGSAHSYASYGPGLLKQVLDCVNLDTHYFFCDWSAIVSECNLREEFNHRFAYLLRMPYLANSLRAPARWVRYQRAKRFPELLAAWRHIERVHTELTRSVVAEEDVLELPLLLNAVLSKVDSLSQFWEVVGEFRHKARRFRQRKHELDHAVYQGNQREIEQLRGALKGDTSEAAKSLTSTMSSLTGVGGILITAFQPRLGGAALSVQLLFAGAKPWLEKNMPGWISEAYSRITAPDRWFLVNVGRASREMLNVRPKIETLWKTRLDDEFGIAQLMRTAEWGVM